MLHAITALAAAAGGVAVSCGTHQPTSTARRPALAGGGGSPGLANASWPPCACISCVHSVDSCLCCASARGGAGGTSGHRRITPLRSSMLSAASRVLAGGGGGGDKSERLDRCSAPRCHRLRPGAGSLPGPAAGALAEGRGSRTLLSHKCGRSSSSPSATATAGRRSMSPRQ